MSFHTLNQLTMVVNKPKPDICVLFRVTRPLFKPPLKPQPTDVGRAREPLPSTPSHPSVARDSGYSSGSRYQSDPVYSPPRAVAAVTPSVSRAQPPEALLSTPDFREADIETPHQPLCLTGTDKSTACQMSKKFVEMPVVF